jgi:hypothetical protein
MERRIRPIPPGANIVLPPPIDPQPDPVIIQPLPIELPQPAHDPEPEDSAESPFDATPQR